MARHALKSGLFPDKEVGLTTFCVQRNVFEVVGMAVSDSSPRQNPLLHVIDHDTMPKRDGLTDISIFAACVFKFYLFR